MCSAPFIRRFRALLLLLACALAPSLLAAPYAHTLPPNAITHTNAVLNGMATPHGRSSTAWFEWGAGNAYQHRTHPVDIGRGNSVVFVTNQISGLTFGHAYHCRLAVSNKLGVAYGKDQLFSVGNSIAGLWDNLSNYIYPSEKDVIAIAGTGGSACGIRTDGKVVEWTSFIYIPGQIAYRCDNVVAAATSDNQSLLLRRDGSVTSWSHFELGVNLPMPVPAKVRDVVAVEVGDDFCLALKKDGTVVAWEVTKNIHLPPGLCNVVAISANANHALALRNNGSVAALAGHCPEGLTDVDLIAAGDTFDLALKKDGTLVSWDPFSDTQTSRFVGTNIVALKNSANNQLLLHNDGTISLNDTPLAVSNAVAIVSGTESGYALVVDHPPIASPLAVSGPPDSDIMITLRGTDPDPGDLDWLEFKIISLPSSGALYQYDEGGRGARITREFNYVYNNSVIFAPAPHSRGASFQYNISDYSLDSAPATVSVTIEALSAATHPATAITSTNALLCGMVKPQGFPVKACFEWGKTTNYGNRSPFFTLPAKAGITFLTNPISGPLPGNVCHFRLVATDRLGTVHGADQTFAFGGQILAWGDNSNAKCDVPPNLTNVASIAAGANHSLALLTDHTVVAWGDNSDGQCNVPSDLTNAIAIAGGDKFSLALTADRRVVGWGTDTSHPADLTNVVAIAGASDPFVLKADGTLAHWRANLTNDIDPLAGLSNIVAIAAGASHSLALKSDGTVTAWGDDSFGQTDVPYALCDVVAIAAGGCHSMALRRNGTLILWGDYDSFRNITPADLTRIVTVTGSASNSLALKSDGTIVAWGNNPSQPPIAPSTITLAAGANHYLALAANKPPSLLAQPHSLTCVAGRPALFSVNVNGSPAPSYQWKKGDANLIDNDRISGAQTSALTLSQVNSTDAASDYSVVVANISGTLQSQPAKLAVLDQSVLPAITLQPANQTLSPGARANLRAVLTGAAPLHCRWQKENTPLANVGDKITGATSSHLTIANLGVNDPGHYALVVSNAYGCVTSSSATLKLLPTVAISPKTPKGDMPNITLSGTASDIGGPGLSQILWRAANTPFQPADGLSNWTANVTLQPGTNLITVKSVDLDGLESPLATRSIFFKVQSPLNLYTNGPGRIAGAANQQLLMVGVNYTVRAIPGSGQLFSNWSGTIPDGFSAANPLTFTMQPEMRLIANFIPNPFLDKTGTYYGLFDDQTQPTNSQPGSLSLILNQAGLFSGKLRQNDTNRPFSGKFALDGCAQVHLTNTPVLNIDLSIDPAKNTNLINGLIAGTNWAAPFSAQRQPPPHQP